MLLRHLCGAILTLFLASSAYATPQERATLAPQERATSAVQEPQDRTPPTRAVKFHLASFSETNMTTTHEKSQLKADTLNEVPATASADMKDPLKYSVWVLIGLGPIMWIWLAFFPRIRRK